MILSFTCNGFTRRIQRVENAVVAVRQDSNVDTVRMIFRPEEYNNIPLSTVSVKFLYVDTDGEIKAYQTGTTPDGGVYVADWELTDDVVDDAGYINFAVKLAVVNGDTVEKQWFSIPDTFRVYDSVDDTNNPPGETAAEQATNAEKIAQLQSQLGTATSDLSSLTSTVALQGAALDAVDGHFCITGNVEGETVQEFIANAVPLLNVPSDLKTATFSAVWANHGYVSGFIRKLRAAGGYNGMFKISSGASASASEEYTFYSWDDVTFYANKMPTRAEMDAVSTVETITAEVNTEEVASGNFIIKKVGNVVSINGYVILANPTKTNVTITLATLPQSVRPSVAIRTTGAVAAHAYDQPEGMCYASVGTNGVLSVRLQTDNLAKNNTVYMSISYII